MGRSGSLRRLFIAVSPSVTAHRAQRESIKKTDGWNGPRWKEERWLVSNTEGLIHGDNVPWFWAACWVTVSSTHQLRRHMFPLKVPNEHSFSPLLASTALPFHFPLVPFATAFLRCEQQAGLLLHRLTHSTRVHRYNWKKDCAFEHWWTPEKISQAKSEVAQDATWSSECEGKQMATCWS